METKLPALLVRLEALEDAIQTCFETVRKLRRDIRALDPTQFPPTPGLSRAPLPIDLTTDPPDPQWIPILHRMERPDPGHPVKPCHLPALYLTEPPRPNQRARFAVMRILPPGEAGWREPTLHDEPRCSSCGGLVDPFSNSDLDYLSVMEAPASIPLASKASRKSRRSGETRAARTDSPDGRVASSASPPPNGGSFPGHTQEADMETFNALKTLSNDLGL